MIKQIEKMTKLDKGTSFQAALLNVIHKNIAKVQTDTFSRGFIFLSINIIFISVTNRN